MNTMSFAFAAAIGNKNIRNVRAIAAAHPLRRVALARKLCGTSAMPLDNATLKTLAKTKTPVQVSATERKGKLAGIVVRVWTPNGMVEL